MLLIRPGGASAAGSRCAGSGVTSWMSVDLEAGGRQRAQRRLAARARALHAAPRRSHAVLHAPCAAASPAATCAANGVPLREPLKPRAPARRPGEHVARRVGDGDDGVVERRLDVDDARRRRSSSPSSCALRSAAAGAAAAPPSGGVALGRLRLLLFGHARVPSLGGAPRFLPAIRACGPLRVRALVCVRWPRTGRPCGDAGRGSSRGPSSRLMLSAISRRRSPSTL